MVRSAFIGEREEICMEASESLGMEFMFLFDYIAVEELVASGSEDAQAGGNSVFSA